MMITHLKPLKYYEDLYDQITVNLCRDIEQRQKEVLADIAQDDPPEKKRAFMAAHEMMLYFEKGERYVKRSTRIQEWMGEDKKKDEQLEKAAEPQNISCDSCAAQMYLETKLLHDDNHDSDKERVLFMFRCNNGCKKGKALYENGEEWIPAPDICKTCSTEMSRTHDRQNETVITYLNCQKCGAEEKEEYTFSATREEKDPHFDEDRKRFCLDDADGGKYIEEKAALEQLGSLAEKQKERGANKELYEKVAKLKRLTIMQVEELLASTLEKESYMKFELGKPDMGKDVFIEFSTRDAKTDRDEYASKKSLKKLLTNTLEDTNWRLMSDGVSYRLGYLTGRLRAYEREEDLVNFFK